MNNQEIPEFKLCFRCNETKTISEFGKNVRAKDGLDFYCRTCTRHISKLQRQRNKVTVAVVQHGLKKCTRCKLEFDVTNFQIDRGRHDGRQSNCRACMSEMQRTRNAKRTATYQAPAGFKWCSCCHSDLEVHFFGVEKGRPDGLAYVCKKCKCSRYQDLRLEILKRYSKDVPFCACCGEKHLEFLSIDHINGGGAEHRRQLKEATIYRWLKRNGYPEGYRVLCHNCNQALGHYGYCPHQKEKA